MNLATTTIFFLCLIAIGCRSTVEKNPKEDESIPTGWYENSNVKIAYYIQGRGPNLILLHAAGHDHRDYDPIISELAQKFRVISIDWPGHGNSVWKTDKEISSIAFPKILEEFLRSQNINQSILMGNSVGGFAALQLAIDHPELVRALVIIDTGGMNELDFSSKLFIRLKSYHWFTSIVWNLFPKYYIKVENKNTQLLLERIRKSKEDPKAIGTNSSIWRSFLDEKYNLREQVRNIKKPTLIVWGANDPIIYPKFGTDLQTRIQNSELHFMETGHLPFVEDPIKFLSILSAFISKANL